MNENANLNMSELLGEDLSAVDVGFPLIKAQAEVKVTEMKVVPNSKGDSSNLIFRLALTGDVKDVAGKVVKAGRLIFGQVSLKVTDACPKELVLGKLKRIRLCFLGCTEEDKAAFGKPDTYVGCKGLVKLDVEAGRDGYDDKTVVASWYPKGSQKGASAPSGGGVPLGI
jgi:hypothetical protein